MPAELAALVAKMMAKDPARRFQTPGEVAQALTPFFKKGNAAFKSPQDRSIPGRSQTNTGRPVAGSRFRADLSRRPMPEGQSVRTEKAAEDTVRTESRWESLIGFREDGTIGGSGTCRRARATTAAGIVAEAIAASLFGLSVLGVIIITIKNRNGNITKITVGDHESATIEVNPPKSTEGGGGINSSMSGISGGISGMGGGMSSTSRWHVRHGRHDGRYGHDG